MEALELSKALKQNTPVILPDSPLKQKIEKICSMFKGQVETFSTKRISPLKFETFPLTAPNVAEYEVIETIEPHPRVNINPLNNITDTPPKVNVKTLTT